MTRFILKTLGFCMALMAGAALLFPALANCQSTVQSSAQPPAAAAVQASHTANKPADTAKIPSGLRVAYASHSLMWDMPPVLAELSKAYGIEGHTIVDHQRIGVSRASQHWDRPDAQNTAKQALRSGKVDVFVMSPLVHPDDAITNFAKLGLEHNPNLKFVVQISWPGLGYTDNEQFNTRGGPFGGRGRGGEGRGRGDQPSDAQPGSSPAEGSQAAAAQSSPVQPSAAQSSTSQAENAQADAGQARGRRGGRRGGFGGGMFQTPADNKPPEELAKIDAIDIKNAEEQIKKINEELGKGKTVAYLVPTAQAHNALRTLIYKKEMPGMTDQQQVFIDPIGHPTAPVITLNAYLHFAVLYQRSPIGLPVPTILKNYNAELAADMNKKLQELAWELVTKYPYSGVTEAAR
jgi:hypothetical protein